MQVFQSTIFKIDNSNNKSFDNVIQRLVALMPTFVTVFLELPKPDVKNKVFQVPLAKPASATLTSATLLARLDSLSYFWAPLWSHSTFINILTSQKICELRNKVVKV